jgi:hypothetical protein
MLDPDPKLDLGLLKFANASCYHYALATVVAVGFTNRRPSEQADFLASVEAALPQGAPRYEVKDVAKTIADTFLEEGQRMAAKTILRRLLKMRFGKLPRSVGQRIDRVQKLARLYRCIEGVAEMKTLDDLRL